MEGSLSSGHTSVVANVGPGAVATVRQRHADTPLLCTPGQATGVPRADGRDADSARCAHAVARATAPIVVTDVVDRVPWPDRTSSPQLEVRAFSFSSRTLAGPILRTLASLPLRHRSLWDIVNGITASARQIRHTEERVKVETAAGRLMRYAEDR